MAITEGLPTIRRLVVISCEGGGGGFFRESKRFAASGKKIFIKPNFAQACLTPLLLIVRAGLPLKILLPMSGGVLPYMG